MLHVEQKMAEFPIIYSAPMILARQAGLKSQTRRIVTFSNSTVLGYCCRKLWAKIDLASPETYKDPGPDPFGGDDYEYLHARVRNPDEDGEFYRVRPRLSVGDHLFVRETHTITGWKKIPSKFQPIYRLDGFYNADNQKFQICLTNDESEKFARRSRLTGKIPPIFSYRSLARSLDEVIGLRVQRVQDISVEDAKAEGITAEALHWNGGYIPAYSTLWDSLHGKGAWERNDWVWVIVSRPISPPKKRLKRTLDLRFGGTR